MKVFLYNHSGSLNRGCEAIVRGTVNILNHSGMANDYILSSYAAQEEEELKDFVSVMPFKSGSLNTAEHIVAALKIRLKKDESYSIIKRYASFFDEAQKVDICLSVGGDTYCYGDNPLICILTDELKKRGKKTVLWGASIGEEDLTTEKEKSLARMDAVFARESLTGDLLTGKELNPNVFVFPDPAFTLKGEALPVPVGWQTANTVGINISPLAVSKNPGIMSAISNFIGYIFQHTDMSVALIPHVTAPSNNDMTMLKALYKENEKSSKGKLLFLPDNLTAAQYKGYIAKLRFLIATRTHASIAAYSSCVPTIVLGYSVKSRGIARDIFGSERFVLNVDSISKMKELADAFMALNEQEKEIKSVLAQNIPTIIKKAYSAGEQLITLQNGD